MIITDESAAEFQALMKKHYGVEYSMEEARDAAANFMGLMEVLWESHCREQKRLERLKLEPQGFHLEEDGTYQCCICDQYVGREETWYDRSGTKCVVCQAAIDKKIIPRYVCKNKNAWYSLWELFHYFGVRSQTALKFVRQGKLKVRTVPNANGTTRVHLFLLKDNPEVLPNKPRSRQVMRADGTVTIEYEKVSFPLLGGGA
jgi:hypothetical protein